MKTIVKLGNAFDTDGCSVVEGIVIKQQKTLLCTNDLILTPRGIVAASKVVGGEKVDFHYSTMCMPIPDYSAWIQSNWDVEVTPEMLEQQKGLKVLEEGMKSDEMACTKASDATKAINLFSPSEYIQSLLSTKRPDWTVAVAHRLPTELHRLGFFDFKAVYKGGKLDVDEKATKRMIEFGGQDELLAMYFKECAEVDTFEVSVIHGLHETRIDFVVNGERMMFVV